MLFRIILFWVGIISALISISACIPARFFGISRLTTIDRNAREIREEGRDDRFYLWPTNMFDSPLSLFSPYSARSPWKRRFSIDIIYTRSSNPSNTRFDGQEYFDGDIINWWISSIRVIITRDTQVDKDYVYMRGIHYPISSIWVIVDTLDSIYSRLTL